VPTKQTLSTNRVIALSAIITLIVVVGSGVFAKGLIAQLILSGKVLTKKQAASDTLQRNLDARQALQANYAALGTASSLVLNALPNTPDFSGLSSLMESLSAQSGVQLRSIAPSQTAAPTQSGVAAVGSSNTTPSSSSLSQAATSGSSSNEQRQAQGQPSAQPPQVYAFTATVVGSYASLLQFFSHIQLSARPIRVTDISLTGGNAQLTADMTLTTYYQPAASLKPQLETVK